MIMDIKGFDTMIEKNDWRLTTQMKYLYKRQLLHIPYEIYSISWDHDHCAFCWEKLYEPSQMGYCTTDKYHWICEDCFNDFHKMFEWDVVERRG